MLRIFTGLVYILLMNACGGGSGGSSPLPAAMPPAPIAVAAQSLTLDEDSVGTLSLNHVLDPAASVSILSAPNDGVLSGDVGALTYTPNLHFNGTDSATVQLTSGNRRTDPFDVAFTVLPVADPPNVISMPDSFSVLGFDSANFGPEIENPDSLALTFTVENLPAWASIDQANGRVVVEPTNADVNRYENLRMTVANSAGSSETEAFSIEVGFQERIDLSVELSSVGFSQTGSSMQMSVHGRDVYLSVEGTDNTGAIRVKVVKFDPLANEVIWEHTFAAQKRMFGPLRANENGVLVAMIDENLNGTASALDNTGQLLWEATPDRISPSNTSAVTDLATVNEQRTLMILNPVNFQSGQPPAHQIAVYEPTSDSLTQADFDSGVPDSADSKRILAESDGSYWLSGGEVLVPSDLGTDTWVRRYASDDTEMFTTLYASGGNLTAFAKHPSGDVVVAGHSLFGGGWFARVDQGGIKRFFASVGDNLVNDFAVHADGSYSVQLSNRNLQQRGVDNSLFEEHILPVGHSEPQIAAHPDYYVLHVLDRRVLSIPQ